MRLPAWQDQTIAANGVPVAENFRAWFRNSQVRTDGGAPMVMYHATTTDFDVFKTNSQDIDFGAHFGTLEQAHVHSHRMEDVRFVPVYLSIQNPLRLIDDEASFALELIHGQLRRHGIRTRSYTHLGTQRAIMAAGYDGIVYLNRHEIEGLDDPWGDRTRNLTDEEVRKLWPHAGDSYIAFKPQQIKSVMNSGLFRVRSPSITDHEESDWLVRALRAAWVPSSHDASSPVP